MNVIQASNLSKQYTIGGPQKQPSFREMLSQQLTAPFRWMKHGRKSKGRKEKIWALKDVSFEIKQGEIVGIIGRNGSGKSTLLKILSRITDPTQGHAEIRGRVASLLEIGTGFHPELTGRENIYLNGTILGMRRWEITRKFDEIVSFAEIEKFIDTPVKRYSSGMYVRLAFAVAAHLDPEILLVDEVLAVGDVMFQKKCLGKMGDVAQGGRTVLFVSHNMIAIKSLCKRCLFLEEGNLHLEGSVNRVVEKYFREGNNLPKLIETKNWPRPQRMGTDLKVNRVYFYSSDKQACLKTDAPFVLEIDFELYRPASNIVYGFSVFSSEGTRVFQSHNVVSEKPYPHLEPGNYRVKATADPILLAPGRYMLDIGFRSEKKGLDWLPNLMYFEIEDSHLPESSWLKPEDGLLRHPMQWSSPSVLIEEVGHP